MNRIDDAHRLTTTEQLEAVYGKANPNSLRKELDHVSEHYRTFIEHSPFVAVSTAGPEGLDCSPRGDSPGFIVVENAQTLLMPDRAGNNRVDSLRNIVRDPRISLLFLVPGVGETLRVNGRAEIVTQPELLTAFEFKGKLPRSVIVIHVERVYFQCQKALARSKLWSEAARVLRSALPSAGDMLAAVTDGFDGEAYDRDYPARMEETLY